MRGRADERTSARCRRRKRGSDRLEWEQATLSLSRDMSPRPHLELPLYHYIIRVSALHGATRPLSICEEEEEQAIGKRANEAAHNDDDDLWCRSISSLLCNNESEGLACMRPDSASAAHSWPRSHQTPRRLGLCSRRRGSDGIAGELGSVCRYRRANTMRRDGTRCYSSGRSVVSRHREPRHFVLQFGRLVAGRVRISCYYALLCNWRSSNGARAPSDE